MVSLEEATEEPGAVSLRSISTNQITVGVLNKWVNIGKGWRDRLFVLQGTALRYYKVGGPSKTNVHVLLESLRRQGTLVVIGAETAVLESKHKSSSFRRSQDSSAQLQPYAEIVLQDATVQLSESDYKKFYVNWPETSFRLRAETRDDCNSWLDAFNKAVGKSGSGVTPAHPSNTERSAGLQQLLIATQRGLDNRGATSDVQQFVEQVLQRQHQEYVGYMSAEADKRRKLLEHIHSLENEKRQLETSMVVDQELQNTAGRGSLDAVEARSDISEGDADSINEEQPDQPLSNSSDDEQTDVWYDCHNTLSRGSSIGGSKNASAKALPEPASTTPPGSTAVSGRESTQQSGTTGAVPSTSGRTEEDPDWLEREGQPPPRRSGLPKPAQAEKSVSLWSIIKECVGKDLTRVCLPVYFNEPFSALQRIAEELEYSSLLDKAASLPKGSVERMLQVAAFAISGYSGTARRTNKPFNPLLGETFEFVCPEQGVRMLIEKVVHHPTVIAAHAWGRGWTFAGDVDLRSKFWGRSIELHPVGALVLTFADGDQYSWHKVSSSINNLIIGKIYIDHAGIMRIRSSSGLVAKLRFHETGMMTREAHQVKGFLERDGSKLDVPRIYGKWDDAMYAELADGSQQLLWKISPMPANPTRYNFTSFAMKLNEITPGLKEKLAPTDSRLRPDQRATENGEYDLANSEKLRLEKKQRAARAAADRGEPIQPRWFAQVPESERTSEDSLAFRYKGRYWDARRKGDFEGCRDIFGPDPAATPLNRSISGSMPPAPGPAPNNA